MVIANMDNNGFYKQIKKGLRMARKYGQTYSYIYMNSNTLESFKTMASGPIRNDSGTDRKFGEGTFLGLTICINENYPDGAVWISNEPPYFPKDEKKGE